nr:transposase [Hymenobacter nivis]
MLHDSPEAFLLVDDSVQDKRYGRFIDVAKRQGNVHGMVTGIGLVYRVHSSGEAGDFLPLDYRVYAPDTDGQTKNDHFLAMVDQVVAEDKLLARTILFDSWYAGSTHLKRMHRAGWTFFTTLRSNRLVSLAQASGYQGLDTLEPPPRGWGQGVEVRLKEVPFGIKRFKLVATNGDMEWVMTNHLAAHLTREIVIEAVQLRWQIEEFHRSFKVGEVPVPQGRSTAQPFDLLLHDLGIAPPTRPPDGANHLSSPPTARGTLPAAVAPKTAHSSTCVVECVSPILVLMRQI